MKKFNFTYYFFFFYLFIINLSCSSQNSLGTANKPYFRLPVYASHYQIQKAILPKYQWEKNLNWIEIIPAKTGILLDIKYATKENFLNRAVYPCGKCFVRPEVAEALLKAQKELQKKGYGLKLFDCYRPLRMQKKMWKIKPDPMYVANPSQGSMHNRGLAVDVTLVDKTGKEIPMGTAYDSFEKKSHSDYKNLPAKILKNRKILSEVMHKYGLEPIRTEWWHYSYRKKKYPIGRWVWDCD